jgi:hypothetical protein
LSGFWPTPETKRAGFEATSSKPPPEWSTSCRFSYYTRMYSSCCRTHPAVAEATSIVSFRHLPPAPLSLYICCQIHTHPAYTYNLLDW